jgi:hypothetical protein
MRDQAFEKARRAMVEAARLTFDDYRRAHPDETFYAFALYADNQGDGLSPASHTQEAYESQLAVNSMYAEDELGLLRYCPDEWSSAYTGSARRDEWSKVSSLLDPILDDTTLSWEQSSGRVFETMIQALGDLDGEGAFGRGAQREAITLMIWITDSGLARDWWARSVRSLNPRTVYERFISEIPAEYRV